MSDVIIKQFDKSGLALLTDIRDDNYQKLYNFLEKEQDFFNKYFNLVNEEYFYKWPKDTLH